MYKSKKILAIITARGGSKGIPGKNIKSFLGKPLLSWTIREAKKSRYLDKVIVSTDSPAIAAVASKFGADVPFLRPHALARDCATQMDVVIHALTFFKERYIDFDVVVVLQPTSPLREYIDIDRAIEMLFKKNAEAVISVCEAFTTPCWMNVLPTSGCMNNFLGTGFKSKPRQRLSRYFQLNGAVYAGFIKHIVKHKSFHGKRTFAYIMPKERSIDIDDMFDFQCAQALLEKRLKKKA